MTVIQKIRAYLELMRHGNCLMAGISSLIAFFITAFILDSSLTDNLFLTACQLFCIFIVVFLATGAGNMLNDYYDIEIDKINKPSRPLPSGRIGIKEAVYLSILFFSCAVLTAFLISPLAGIVGFINVFMLIWYAKFLKRTILIGNFSIAYLTGSTFLFGAASFGIEGLTVMLPLALLSFLATAAREIVKDIEDIDGDSKDGAVTFPIRFGARSASYLAALFGFAAVILSPLPYFMGILSVKYFYVLIFGIFCFFYAIYSLLRKDYAGSSKFFKIAMFLALGAFIAGLF